MPTIIIAKEPHGDFLVLALHQSQWTVIATTPTRPLADQIATLTTRSRK